MTTAEAKLAAARKELLDLGLRNPLLNYRPLKARGVTIVDEKTTNIFKLLVKQQRYLTFEPKPDAPQDDTGLAQPLDNGRYTDNKLQTPYSATALQKRLLTTAHIAKTTVEERGVNLLYLALGMLRWRDRRSIETDRFAPLILVPVLLERPAATARYRLTYSGADLTANLSLEARLRVDFGLTLPHFPVEDDLDVADYFDAVRTAVSTHSGWAVEPNKIALAFFSFNKLFMIKDLDPASWPTDQHPAYHPILQHLLSDKAHFAPLNHTPTASTKLHDSFHVVDADSSQAEALHTVNAGQSIVIQGPPGTGKSQTITNVIAEAIGRGKSVLFVSEKMAALDVVKRRLDEAGIGDAALQLHGHRTTKAALMADLHRTLLLGQPKPDPTFAEGDELDKLRHRLSAYAQAANAPIGKSAVTPREAVGRLLQIEYSLGKSGSALPPLHLPNLPNQSSLETEGQRSQVGDLEKALYSLGYPKQHPFYGTRATETDANAPVDIRQTAQTALDALNEAMSHAAALAALLHQPTPQSERELFHLMAIAQRLLDAPNLYAVDVANPRWHTETLSLRRVLGAGVESQILREQYDDWLVPAAWQADLAALRHPLRAHGASWFRRLFSVDYRRARSDLLGYCRSDLPNEPDEIVSLVDAVLAVQESKPLIAQYETTLKQLFGVRWLGEAESDWSELNRVGLWLIALHEDVANGRVPHTLIAFLATGFNFRVQERLKEANLTVQTAWSRYHTVLDALAIFQLGDLPDDIASQKWRLTGWVQAAERYIEMVAFNQLSDRLRAAGLGDVVSALEDERFAEPALRNSVLDWFDWHWFSSLYQKARFERAALAEFDADVYETAIDRFCELDVQCLHHNRVRLAHQHWVNLPRHKPSGLVAHLYKESAKKRNHMPIRQLFGEMGRVVQRIKPVWMMSPLSIASYLPPGALEFDLVVFDEASQVRPVEAFGAILRAKQVVVVGDSKQLPPTTFFDRVLGDPSEEATFEDEAEGITASNESILDLFVDRGAPQRMLRWHYRSRHESLIAVSNREFYGERLLLFPSPDSARRDLGLKLHHLPNAVYDRGKTRTNLDEAAAVARAVIDHAQATPELTLGVAAFSAAQREAIALEVEKLRRATPEAESFFRAHSTEPFFIKNLENVQGDERDVVLVSVGYGRSADGSVSLNFGPLNGDGGERRLNVLMTRARRRCVLFTNLRAADIDLRRTTSIGIAALKAVLKYAETGRLERFAPHQSVSPTPFADRVAVVLRQAGYRVEQNVGHNGVTIDVAVADPTDPARFVIGVLCDGATDAHAATARDRERIQPAVLVGLGWRLVHVWSPEWIANPEEGERRLLTAVSQALQRDDVKPPTHTKHTPIPRYAPAPLAPRVGDPYKPSTYRFTLPEGFQPEPPPPQAVAALCQIVADEGPIHLSLLRSRFESALTNVMHDIEPLWRSVQRYVVTHKLVDVDVLYYRPVGQTAVPLRKRDTLPAHQRKFDYVSNWELDAGLYQLVQDAVAIDPLDLIPLTLTLFGYGKLSHAAQQRVFDRTVVLLKQGRFYLQNGWVTLPHSQSSAASQHDLDALAEKRPKYASRKRRKTGLEKLIERKKIGFEPYRPFTEPLIFKSEKWQLSCDSGEILLRYVEACRFDADSGQYVASYPYDAYFRSDYQDIGASQKRTQPITALLGSFGYDLVRGGFCHNSYLGALTTRTLRPDKLLRVWRDPDSGALLVRRVKPMEEKLYKRFYFTHPTDRLDPDTGELTPIEKRVVANEMVSAEVAVRLGGHVPTFEQQQFDALVAAESPIPIEMLTQRYEDALGLTWPVVRQMVERLVEEGEARCSVRRVGKFVWAMGMKRPLPRNRATLQDKWRKMATVAPDEIGEAIRQILAVHQPLETKLLIGMAAYLLLGKKRLGKVEQGVVTAVLDMLQARGEIEHADGKIQIKH